MHEIDAGIQYWGRHFGAHFSDKAPAGRGDRAPGFEPLTLASVGLKLRATAASPSGKARDCKSLIITFSSKFPRWPATVTVVWFPITRAATIIIASHITGFTLPGMIELPG